MNLLALLSIFSVADCARSFSGHFQNAIADESFEFRLGRSSRDLIGWNRQFNAANQPKWTNPNEYKMSINQQLNYILKSGKFGTKTETMKALKELRQYKIQEQKARRAKMLKRLGY